MSFDLCSYVALSMPLRKEGIYEYFSGIESTLELGAVARIDLIQNLSF